MGFSICNLLLRFVDYLNNIWNIEQLNDFLKYVSDTKQHLISEIKRVEVILVQ